MQTEEGVGGEERREGGHDEQDEQRRQLDPERVVRRHRVVVRAPAIGSPVRMSPGTPPRTSHGFHIWLVQKTKKL